MMDCLGNGAWTLPVNLERWDDIDRAAVSKALNAALDRELRRHFKMRVYLAAPFFTLPQRATLTAVEDALCVLPNVEFYSPRQDGIVLQNYPVEERAAKAQEVFATNIARLDWCDIVCAIIDDRDAGTMIEVGYAIGKGKKIVTYTGHDYGLNVMLQEAVIAHVKSLQDLTYIFEKGLPDEVCALFRIFHPSIT